ncbi:MAG: aminomethyltransferase, partial [Albidovulum sp.]|nr:aminomethyltransferase [Albidovulum sp.]
MATLAKYQTIFERNGVIVPGMPVLAPGVERYPVPGGGTRTVSVEAGDEIGILDVEGQQRAELAFFASDGSSNAGMIGAKSAGRANGISAALGSCSQSGSRALKKLEQLGFSMDDADAVHALGDGSRPGDLQLFSAACDGTLVVAAPGTPMSPSEQDFPSQLILYVQRARKRNEAESLSPPDPLADPIEDMNILPGEAKC